MAKKQKLENNKKRISKKKSWEVKKVKSKRRHWSTSCLALDVWVCAERDKGQYNVSMTVTESTLDRRISVLNSESVNIWRLHEQGETKLLLKQRDEWESKWTETEKNNSKRRKFKMKPVQKKIRNRRNHIFQSNIRYDQDCSSLALFLQIWVFLNKDACNVTMTILASLVKRHVSILGSRSVNVCKKKMINKEDDRSQNQEKQRQRREQQERQHQNGTLVCILPCP